MDKENAEKFEEKSLSTKKRVYKNIIAVMLN